MLVDSKQSFDVKRYLHISSTNDLLPQIQIDTMGYHKVGKNDNLLHDIGNIKEMAYTNVSYRHLHLYFCVDGGILSNGCPESHITKSITLPLLPDDRLRRTSVYNEGLLSAIYVPAHRNVIVVLLRLILRLWSLPL